MTITAQGPKIDDRRSTARKSRLSTWTSGTSPASGPDGSSHKFNNVAIGKLPRTGYFGFQDHGSDCWFKNVKIKELD